MPDLDLLVNVEACDAQYRALCEAVDRYEIARQARDLEMRRLIAEAQKQLDAIAEALAS